MTIELDRETLRNLESSLSCEWLETNGLGGFASSTVIGLNTRRYHSLLTAATKPPVGRLVLLSKLEETLVIEGRRYDLSCNEYTGGIHPRGFMFQTQFRLDPFPVFTYEVEGVRLEKSVLMVQGQNTTVVHYELHSATLFRPASLLLEVRPLIAFRDYHNTTHENAALDARVETEDGITSLKPYADLPWLHLAHDVAECEQTAHWYRNFQYAIERERGLDFAEDSFNPCSLIFDLNRYSRARIFASTERRDIRSADFYREGEIIRRQAISAQLPANDLVKTLTAAANQYIVARGEQKTIIAGYHWFSDWGRDTMIALPGLTLATNRTDIARSILSEFAQHVDQGMLPNRFPDVGETPEYNTVDATLWFFEAVHSLLHYTNDYDFVYAQLYKVLQEIVAWHIKGTRYNIHLDTDGLLFSGEPGVQLTWMDAKVGDWVVTPRTGKPVEIQALWYNALRIMEHLADRFGEPHSVQEYSQLAEQADTSFNQQFWNESQGCLYDVINGEERDGSIRPNQIIALSLTHSVVSKTKAKEILNVVERELLTPRGLRTLSPVDPKYHPRYEGDPLSRDGAYHQGTVWPWLMGPFIRAYAKTFGQSAGQSFGAEWLQGFEKHLHEACLGQVSEIFDAEAPYLPRGCVAQAWSVGELLRAAVEDVFVTTPSGQSASVSG
ncbi:MAG TPA: amylo-alpha-1,6-glucosidase [Pyrinomonadaceae bacterium]|nr:amylo-alpha-1,6-glucosidase [Pyrinomonadaceae bacterium]